MDNDFAMAITTIVVVLPRLMWFYDNGGGLCPDFHLIQFFLHKVGQQQQQQSEPQAEPPAACPVIHTHANT